MKPNTRKPKWSTSERFERIGEFTVPAAPEKVFPLLCPVLEYDWIPDWTCTMVHSKSGVAERDAIFVTPQKMHKKVVWTAITWEPSRLVEYLLVMGTDAVVRVSISLEELGKGPSATTKIAWRMLFTAASPLARIGLRSDFTEEKFQAMLGKRKRELTHYLETGTMIAI
jgi:hypothetical protein